MGLFDVGTTGSGINVGALESNAANIKTGTNPTFAYTDFIAAYPQFSTSLIPEEIVNMYISLAHACIKQERWKSYWKIAMGWFVAHFTALYVQGTADSGSDAATVIAAADMHGIHTSETVGDVSVTMDDTAVMNDLNGWASWKLSIYGTQLATIGKLIGKGGMYIR